jgi:hypothetical protein
MRIVENSPDRVRLHDSSVWISVIGFAVAAVIAGFAVRLGDPRGLVGAALFGACGLAFLRATDVILDKSARTLTVRRRDLFRVRRALLPFSDITDVRVDAFLGGKWSKVITCRMSLVTTSDVMPLTGSFESGLERYDEMRATLLAILFPSRPRPAPTDPDTAMVGFGLAAGGGASAQGPRGFQMSFGRAGLQPLAPDVDVRAAPGAEDAHR